MPDSQDKAKPKRRWWWIACIASFVALLIFSWQWKTTEHACKNCDATKTSKTASFVFWKVYSSNESSVAGEDHQHDWGLRRSRSVGGPFNWFDD